MPSLTLTIEYQTESERAALERAFAFVSDIHQLAQSAPSAAVLPLCEAYALDQGRRLLRDTLQSAAQSRIDHAEQKGGPLVSARAPAATASRAATNATS